MAQKQGGHKTLKTKGNQEPWEVRCFRHQSFCCQHLQMRDEIQGPSKAGNLIGDLINKARTFKISECKINPTRQNNTITKVVSLKKNLSQEFRAISSSSQGFVVQIHTTTAVQELSSGKFKVVTNR